MPGFEKKKKHLRVSSLIMAAAADGDETTGYSKILKTERGKPIFVDHSNYQFIVDKKNADGSRIYWKCIRVKECSARIVTDENYNLVKKGNKAHDHASTAQEIKAREVTNDLKESAKDQNTGKSVQALLADHMNGMTRSEMAALPKMANMRRNVNNWRSGDVPAAPTSRCGFEIPEKYATFNGKKFLIFDSGIDDPDRMLVFGTPDGIQDLKDSGDWGIDGTFKDSPPDWYQVVSIHAILNQSQSTPRLWSLLPGKKFQHYRKFFTVLTEVGLDKDPNTMICDFEKGIFETFEEIHPGTLVSFCTFHFSRNILRKVREDLKMGDEYNKNEDFNTPVRCIMALCLIPADDVVSAFDEILENYELPDELVLYMQKYYIGAPKTRNKRTTPEFKIEHWNVNERIMRGLPRSNNMLEGYHHAFHTLSGCSHPSIWKLIDTMKRYEVIASKKIKDSKQGHESEQKKKYQRLTKQIEMVLSKYDSTKKLANSH